MTEPKYRRDIEETDEELEREEPTPIEFWEKKQRELVSSVVDYNLSGLTDLISSKTIDLSPEYQRRYRWDDERKSRLIESFLMNVPVPPVFLNEDSYGQYSVIDGKQRLNTVSEFIRGRLILKGLKIFSDINGLSFDALPSKLQSVIKTRPTLRAIIILRQSDEDVKFEVFQRLNTGGVRLNAQEIRNSAYTGKLNNLILELSVSKYFHRMLGIKNKDKSAIYQEMRDAELVLRFLTFHKTWETFTSRIKGTMDRYMADNRQMKEPELIELKTDFLKTLDTVEAAFGGHAFQRWMPEKNEWKSQVLAALYDAEMFACRGLDREQILPKQEIIINDFKKMFSDPEFRRSIDAATNTASFFRARIRMVREMLESALQK